MAHYWNNWVALDDWVIWHHVRIHVIGSWGVIYQAVITNELDALM